MIPLERLMSLALGELDDDLAACAEVEEHVLACGACAATLERLVHIGSAVRDAVIAGKVSFPVTGALLAELERAKLVSRSYRLVPDGTVPCAVGSEDILTLTTLVADLRGAQQVDLVQNVLGQSHRMPDVPFDAELGLVRVVTRCDFIRTLPTTRLRLELFAVDASGERKLSQYFLDHTGFSAAQA